jgi:NRPS condensation-like uncharacterized protein
MPRAGQPAALPDRLLYSSTNVVDPDLHCVIRLAGHLDPEQVGRATALLLEAQPILAMRFVPGHREAHWECMPAVEAHILFQHADDDADDQQLREFLTTPSDCRVGPQAQVRLFHPVDAARSERGDTLCLKVSHVAADAHSVAECAYLVAAFYAGLASGCGRERPTFSDRALTTVYRRLTAARVLRAAGHAGLDRVRSLAAGPWRFPSAAGPALDPVLLVRHIGEDRIRPLAEMADAHQATLNDAVLAAYVRALAEIHPLPRRPRLRLQTTVDLRRYLPRDGADASRPAPVANLSGWAWPDVGFDPGPEFSDTLILVRDEMRRLKACPLGLGDWLLYALPFGLLPFGLAHRLVTVIGPPSERGIVSHPPFTNLGALEPSRLDFGHAKATQAFLTVPIMRPPFVFLGVSGFGQSLTFTAGFWEPAVDRRRVQRLLDAIERELPRESSRRPSGTRQAGST